MIVTVNGRQIKKEYIEIIYLGQLRFEYENDGDMLSIKDSYIPSEYQKPTASIYFRNKDNVTSTMWSYCKLEGMRIISLKVDKEIKKQLEKYML